MGQIARCSTVEYPPHTPYCHLSTHPSVHLASNSASVASTVFPSYPLTQITPSSKRRVASIPNNSFIHINQQATINSLLLHLASIPSGRKVGWWGDVHNRWSLTAELLFSHNHELALSPGHHRLLCLSSSYDNPLLDSGMSRTICKLHNIHIVRISPAIEIPGKV